MSAKLKKLKNVFSSSCLTAYISNSENESRFIIIYKKKDAFIGEPDIQATLINASKPPILDSENV